MKKIYLFICLTITINSVSQKRSPSIVVLNVQNKIVSNELDSIVKTFIRDGLSDYAKESIREENGDRFKFKAEKEISFLEKVDVFSSITFGLNYFLSYKFFEYSESLLVFPVIEKHNSKLVELELIADKYDVNWVVDIKRITLYKEEEKFKGKVTYQLYNQKNNKIVISKQIKVDDKNPGFEFACQVGTIECVINNITREMSLDILSTMNSNKRYWR